MDDLKICVYAICKNEEKFVDRWISSLINEADYIVVLDTGSTDNTVAELQKYAPKVRVEQKIITPWRFDTARNESMKLIPEDADICCVADLDQVWRPGWGEALKECFRKGIVEPCGDIINYAEDGSEEGRITSRNVHPNDPDYWWERPIHEGLYYHGTKDRGRGFSEKFTIEHRQDKSKSRGNYLNLLETWYKEEVAKLPGIPLDPYCAIYYGCELGFHNRIEESQKVFHDSLTQCDFSKNPEILYQTYLNIAAYHKERNELELALDFSKKAEETGVITRKLCCSIGEILNRLGRLDESIEYYEKALDIHPAYLGWEEDRNLYQPGKIEFDLAIICYCAKQYEKAYKYGQIAYSQLQTTTSYENLQYYINALNNERKVCVYAICKNEDYNIREWFNCVKDANAIVILDTGSTDKTWDILEELSFDNSNLHIFRKEYDDLNFSKMRNDCLALTYSFTYSGDWILVDLDLDEFLEDHGIELIRVRWKSEYDCMNLTGITPRSDSQIVFRKIHSSTAPWYWKRRVHETLSRTDKKKKDWVVGNSEVSYTHIQNTSTKHRNYYELLQKENEENPGDELTLIYLSWEAFLHNEIEKALEYNRECLKLFHESKVDLDDDFPWEKEAIKMQACLNLANYEKDTNKRITLMEECLSDIDKGLFYPCRRIYMEAADIYWSANLKEKNISLYKKALDVRTEPSTWFNAKYEDSDIFSKLGIACYYADDVISALNYGLLAKDMVNVNIYYRPKYREIYGKDYPLIYQGLEGSLTDKPEISDYKEFSEQAAQTFLKKEPYKSMVLESLEDNPMYILDSLKEEFSPEADYLKALVYEKFKNFKEARYYAGEAFKKEPNSYTETLNNRYISKTFWDSDIAMRGTEYIKNYIRKKYGRVKSVLDIGANDGYWGKNLLGLYESIDAVEINPEAKLPEYYGNVFKCSIENFSYENYDLIILGDIVEHLEVGTAQNVLRYAYDHGKELLIIVPYTGYQAPEINNKYQEHIQNELTPELMSERYPMLIPLAFDDTKGIYVKKH